MARKNSEVPKLPVPTEPISSNELISESEEDERLDESQIPEKWVNLDIPSFLQRGYYYRIKTKHDGKQYMCLRKGKSDKSLGRYTPSKEKLLFHLYPEMKQEFLERHPSKDRITTSARRRPFLTVPIRRVTVVPAQYKPNLTVIRYYHIFKNNDFPGDFSDFLNGIVEDHFAKCNGVMLPVLLEEIEEQKEVKME